MQIKGRAVSLQIYREGSAEVLEPGSSARSGDRLQLRYRSDAPHGAIVSVDGAGAVTLHHPRTPRAPADLEAGGWVWLDRSFVLDDAPAYERFFLVGSVGPVDPGEVLRAAEALARRPDAEVAALAVDAEVASVILRKVP